MSEWKRNKRRKDGFPKGLFGKKVEARHRDGDIFIGIEGEHIYLNNRSFNTADGLGGDVMAYRILEQIEPVAPDYTNGYPEGTTAKDIGAKVGDEFVVVVAWKEFKKGDVVKLCLDDESTCPFFNFSGDKNDDYRCMMWSELAPVPPKSAIELQAEEVGIPDLAKEWPEDRIDVVGQNGNDGLHYGIDTSPERVEIDQENVRITPETLTLRDIAPALKSAGVTIKREDDPRTAPDFLQSALQTLTRRGKDYDKPEGERSASAVAVAFNAITGRNLTEAEVWLVLQLVKDVRQWQNHERYHADSALDCVAYAALKAEALAKGGE